MKPKLGGKKGKKRGGLFDKEKGEEEEFQQKMAKRLKGLKVNANARFQFLPRIDFAIHKSKMILNVTGDVNAVLNFSAAVDRKMKGNFTLFRLPKKPVSRSKCVSYFCVTFAFQAAVKIDFEMDGEGYVGSNTSADYAFEAVSEVDLHSGKPVFHANSTKLVHWEQFKFHHGASPMKVKVSLVPGLTLFTVPGAPVSLLPTLDSEVNVGEGGGSTEPDDAVEGEDEAEEGAVAENATAAERRLALIKNPLADKCLLPASALNLFLRSPIKAFGLPEEVQVNWREIGLSIIESIAGAALEVIDAIKRMTANCEVPLSEKAIDAIRYVAKASMGVVKAVVPKNLNLAFPLVEEFEGHVPFCWTMGSIAGAIGGTCGAPDPSVSCPDTGAKGLQPRDVKRDHAHVWPHGNIGVTMNMQGCDFSRLEKETALSLNVDAAVKEAVASRAGDGIAPGDVQVEHVAELDAFVITVTPDEGVSSSDVQLALSSTDELQEIVIEKMDEVPGIGAVFDLPVRIASISAPALHPCPLTLCDPGDEGKMKSHGMHSVCRADPGDNTADGDGKIDLLFDAVNPITLKACEERCRASPKCRGIEYEHKSGRCEVWNRALHFCSMTPVASAQHQDLRFECFTFCK